MTLDRTLFVTLYDKEQKRQGWISNPISVTVTERFLAMSTGEITVSSADVNLPAMMQPGARVTVRFRPLPDSSTSDYGYMMISGPLRNPRGSFLPGGTVTFQIESDWRVLRNTLARVVPTNALEASSLSDPGQSWSVASPPSGEDGSRNGYFNWGGYTAINSVTMVQQLLDQVNVRWTAVYGSPILFVSGTAPGILAIPPQVRFGSVEKYVVPLLQASGAGLRIYAGSGGLVAEIWQPKTWPTVFTPESGVVRDGEWSMSYPEATHVTVGGPGDLAARAFLGVNNTALAAAHRDLIEVFREATGAPAVWPTSLAEQYRLAKYYMLRPEPTAAQKAEFQLFLQRAGEDVLFDGAPTSGVSLELSESKGFQYSGTGFNVGDIITVAPSSQTAITGLTFTDRITEVTVSVSSDKGLTVTPQVGQKKDDPDTQLALAVQSLAAANNRRNINQ